MFQNYTCKLIIETCQLQLLLPVRLLLQSVGKEATDMRAQAVPNAVEVGGRVCLRVHHLGRHVRQAACVGHCLRVVLPDAENIAPSERV